MLKWRLEWLWGGAALFLLAGTLWGLPGSTRGGRSDTFSTSLSGKKAFYELVARLYPMVDRDVGNVIPLEELDTFCLLGPSRYPSATEWERLYEWTAAGRTLVFAARGGDPVVDLGSFGVRVVPLQATEGDVAAEDVLGEGEERSGSDEIETDLVPGNVVWKSGGKLRISADPGEYASLLTLDGTEQAVQKVIESGVLVVLASDYVFTNHSLSQGDNGVLAVRLLESGWVRGPIVFGEALNQSGPPNVVRLLIEPPLRPITFQLLLAGLLLLWWAGRRFGAPQAESQTARRTTVAHAKALGNLYYRASAGNRGVAAYNEYLRDELRLSWGGREGAAARLARRSGRTPAEVGAVLEEARTLAKQATVSNGRASKSIRSLARLKNLVEAQGRGEGWSLKE